MRADPQQIKQFFDALFRHAEGGFVSLRAFTDKKTSTKPFAIKAVEIASDNRDFVIEEATRLASSCATSKNATVFCPPVVTFQTADNARSDNVREGIALSVDCDAMPSAAREKLEGLLGPATVVVASGGEWTDPETGELQEKIHLHWRLSEPTQTEKKHQQLKLARELATGLAGGDTTNVPLVHPIRWPGSVHRKSTRRLCRIVELREDREIELENALECLRKAKGAQVPSKDANAPLTQHSGTTDLYPRKRKTSEDYERLFRGMKTDGKKHQSVRDVVASMAAQGCNRNFIEGLVRANCPVWDNNVENLIDSALEKYSPSNSLPEWAQGWVFNEKLMEFHHIPTCHSIKGGAFNAKFNREQECEAADTSATNLIRNQMDTVADTIYWPCDERILTYRGLSYVNTYRKHDLVAKKPTTDVEELAVEVVLKHARHLISENLEAELLLDFLAYVIQNPGKKVRWAIVLVGIQGNGKSFWVELMKRLLGSNASEVGGTTVSQRFTGWAMEKTFIAIEEIRVPSESKYAVLDKLKPFISNTEVNVEQKGKDDHVVPNFASYLLLTNHDDALPIDDGDRRYCVIETSPRTKAEIPGQDYFDELFGVLERHPEALLHYFNERKIGDDFNPNGRAPETQGKYRMMQESKTRHRLAVEEAIEELRSEVINEKVVFVGALRDQEPFLSDISLPDARTIGRELKAMGYIKYTVGKRHQGPKVEGKERTIYYRPDRILPPDFMPNIRNYVTRVPF